MEKNLITKTLAEIAELVDGVVDGDGSLVISGVTNIEEAGSQEITFAVPPSITATQEFVVPRSIPMIFSMAKSSPFGVALLCFLASCGFRNGASHMPFR